MVEFEEEESVHLEQVLEKEGESIISYACAIGSTMEEKKLSFSGGLYQFVGCLKSSWIPLIYSTWLAISTPILTQT